jgi:hypothetical protein
MPFTNQFKNPEGISGYISNECPRVDAYWLLGDAGSVTIKGFFVRRDGRQTGLSVSTTVPVGDTSNNPVQIASTFPEDAVGFIGNTSGGLRMGLNMGATADAALFNDLKANSANYPLIAGGNALNFGSVAVV